MEDISLTEFISYVLAKSGSELPPYTMAKKKWNRLFFNLKTSKNLQGKPSVLKNLKFDWDGTYPTSPDLSGAFNALAIGGVACSLGPRFEYLTLDTEIKKITCKKWRDLIQKPGALFIKQQQQPISFFRIFKFLRQLKFMKLHPFSLDFWPRYGLVEEMGLYEVKRIKERHEARIRNRNFLVRKLYEWFTVDGTNYPYAVEILRRNDSYKL